MQSNFNTTFGGNFITKILYIFRALIFLCLIITVSSCTDHWEFVRKIQEEKKKTHPHLMNIETMFSEKGVQELALAAGLGDTKKIQEIIDQGVDVNSIGKNGGTPLYWAIREGSLAGFNYLLKAGANPNYTLYDYRVAHNYGLINVMSYAVAFEKAQFLESSLSYGGNPDFRSHSEDPLIFAALGKNRKLMRLLLDAGADTTVLGRSYGTLAQGAVFGRNYDDLYWLIEQGLDYKQKNNRGENVIDTMSVPSYSSRLQPNS